MKRIVLSSFFLIMSVQAATQTPVEVLRPSQELHAVDLEEHKLSQAPVHTVQIQAAAQPAARGATQCQCSPNCEKLGVVAAALVAVGVGSYLIYHLVTKGI